MILNYLKQHKISSVKELASIVWASESSVRRDIKALEQSGAVRQTYGGVVLSDYANDVVPIRFREPFNASVKDTIAQRATEHIFDNATVFMDGSSTVKRMLKYMDGFKNLKVITNNQRIFSEYGTLPIRFYCTGGRFDSKSEVFLGDAAERYVDGINADVVFFSAQALSNEGVISDVAEEEIALKMKMISRARKKIFLCDSSKLGLEKTFRVCTKDELDAMICDRKLPWEQ